MKIRIITLFIFVSASIHSQEPALFSLEKTLNTYIIDSSKIAVKARMIGANEQVRLIRPVYITSYGKISSKIYDYEYFNYLLTDAGDYVKQNDMVLSVSDSKKFLEWRYSLRKEYEAYKQQQKEKKESEKLPAQTPFEKKQSHLQASVKMMSEANTWHEYLTVFTGELELNFSHQRLLDFLYNHMQMSEKSNDFETGYIISKCVQRTTGKGNPDQLNIRYKVKSESGYFFPERVEITGTPRRVIELFVLYWPAKIQIDDAQKGGKYTCYMLPDKITLSINTNGKASISIVKQ